MSILSRLVNTLLFRRSERELRDELESHLSEAIEQGRSPADAAAAFGSSLRFTERSRDLKLLPWLDTLRSDVIFGWRQVKRNGVSSLAAVLSLALAVGACATVFRLLDALLWRPLPVAHAERLYAVGRSGLGPGGDFRISDSSEYPLFRLMRDAVKDGAELVAVSYADRVDVLVSSAAESEKVQRQYVSGWVFNSFGLHAAVGRLLTEDDDRTPGASPHIVISTNYWARRFGRQPGVVGQTVRIGDTLYDIVGVVDGPFTGTEPGIAVDMFVPCSMNPYISRADASWFRPLALVKDGANVESIRTQLDVVARAFQRDRAATFTNQSKQFVSRFLNQTVVLMPAAAGISGLQRDYQRSLLILSALAVLVLIIAAANVATLMAAQATARAREIALRISIGAGRWRLLQLMLAESAWLGGSSAAMAALFTWWAAPILVARINPPDNPVHLYLPPDSRILGFLLLIAVATTVLIAILPAWRVSTTHPSTAIKGGEHQRGTRVVQTLIAVQVAFCLVLLTCTQLFVSTQERLTAAPLGFSPDHLVIVEARSAKPQANEVWNQTADHLRSLSGVTNVAVAGWPLLGGNGSNGTIWVNGEPTEVLAYFLGVSPEWRTVMDIKLLAGRDLRADESSPGVALINEAFVQQCFGGANPIGRAFTRGNDQRQRFVVAGVVNDARYRNLREPITPTAYIPFASQAKDGSAEEKDFGAFIVRTGSIDPMLLAPSLRRAVPGARSELRVSNVRSQVDLVVQQTLRERLLAQLALFFSSVALLLAGIGIYGVLQTSVSQRQREIGIRLAVGSPSGSIIRTVTARPLAMVVIGIGAGAAVSLIAARSVQSLLYGVAASDLSARGISLAIIFIVAVVAALPAAWRAVRTEPLRILRSE